MAFLLPIPIALLVGMVWTYWASRPARPADPVTTVEQWSRAISRLAPTHGGTERAARKDQELARSA